MSTINVNTSRRANFYPQGQQRAARILRTLTLWLLASCSLEGTLAVREPCWDLSQVSSSCTLQDSPEPPYDNNVASTPAMERCSQSHISQEDTPDEPLPFQARGGERVRFYYQQGRWRAEVSSRIGAFHRHLVIPVVCLQGVDVASSLEVLYKYPIWYSQRQIHVLGENVCPTLGKVVYVGELGLRGGWLGRRARSKSTAERDQVTQDCQNAAAEDSNNPTIVTTQRGGLYRFFIIDGIPYRSIAGLVCIGLAQIAAGCFLTSYPLGEKVSKISKVSNFLKVSKFFNFSKVLVIAGVKYMVYAVKCGINREVKWPVWKNEVTSYVVLLGLSVVTKEGQAATTTQKGLQDVWEEQIRPQLSRGIIRELGCYVANDRLAKTLVSYSEQRFIKQITEQVKEALANNDVIQQLLGQGWKNQLIAEIDSLNLDFQMPNSISKLLGPFISILHLAQNNELAQMLIAIFRGIASGNNPSSYYAWQFFDMGLAGLKICCVTKLFLNKFIDQSTKYTTELPEAQQQSQGATDQPPQPSQPQEASTSSVGQEQATMELVDALVAHIAKHRTEIIQNDLIMPANSMVIDQMLNQVERWLADQKNKSQEAEESDQEAEESGQEADSQLPPFPGSGTTSSGVEKQGEKQPSKAEQSQEEPSKQKQPAGRSSGGNTDPQQKDNQPPSPPKGTTSNVDNQPPSPPKGTTSNVDNVPDLQQRLAKLTAAYQNGQEVDKAELEKIAIAAQAKREAEKTKAHDLNVGAHAAYSIVDPWTAQEIRKHKAEEKASKQVLDAARKMLGRPRTPTFREKVAAGAKGFAKSGYDTVETVGNVVEGAVGLGVDTISAVGGNPEKLQERLQKGSEIVQQCVGGAVEYAKQALDYSPEAQAQRQEEKETREREALRSRALDADTYHREQAEQVGYIAGEVTQLAGPAIFQGVNKLTKATKAAKVTTVLKTEQVVNKMGSSSKKAQFAAKMFKPKQVVGKTTTQAAKATKNTTKTLKAGQTARASQATAKALQEDQIVRAAIEAAQEARTAGQQGGKILGAAQTSSTAATEAKVAKAAENLTETVTTAQKGKAVVQTEQAASTAATEAAKKKEAACKALAEATKQEQVALRALNEATQETQTAAKTLKQAKVARRALPKTAKDTPAAVKALQEEDVARKALFEADEKRKATITALKEAQKNKKELTIAAHKAEGATQRALREEQAANTTATGAKATHTADKKKAVVQTEQAASEVESGVQATQATTQQAGAIKGANHPLKPLTHVSESQAEEVANAVGGRVARLADNKKGYVIEIGHPDHPTMTIRLMNRGSGQREQAYMKISKRFRAIDKNGNWEHNPALIHIDLYEGDIVAQVQEILDKFEKMLQSKK